MKNEDVKVAVLAEDMTPATDGRVGLLGIVGAVAIGLFMVFAAGFAQATVMHDTSHDQRHAMAFPCH